MGYRRFTDENGDSWEVRDRSTSEWEFVPVPGNPHQAVRVRAPGYEKDPFELSGEELQRLLDAERPGGRSSGRPSPFKD